MRPPAAVLHLRGFELPNVLLGKHKVKMLGDLREYLSKPEIGFHHFLGAKPDILVTVLLAVGGRNRCGNCKSAEVIDHFKRCSFIELPEFELEMVPPFPVHESHCPPGFV